MKLDGRSEVSVMYLDREKNQYKTQNIITTYFDKRGRNGISVGQKLTLIDPDMESESHPLFAYVRGFYTDILFASDDNHVLPITDYRALNEADRTFLSTSKYPHTEDLRDYNNWLFFSQMKRDESSKRHAATVAMDMRNNYGIDTSDIGLALFHNMAYVKTTADPKTRKITTEFLPRHLHYDDFIEKWGGNIQLRMTSTAFFSGRPTNKYGGIVIDTNFRPAAKHKPLDGVEWFANDEFIYYYGPKDIWEKAVNDLMYYGGHPDVNIYAVLNREEVGRHGTLEMWDPVKDIVKVEKILGNVSFLSEFGYICTMNKYHLILGEDLEMRSKYCLL